MDLPIVPYIVAQLHFVGFLQILPLLLLLIPSIPG